MKSIDYRVTVVVRDEEEISAKQDIFAEISALLKERGVGWISAGCEIHEG